MPDVASRALGRLLLSAIVVLLWASVPHASAQMSTERQEINVQANSEVSWGSAGGCVQNIKTNDFGEIIPDSQLETIGGFNATPELAASRDAAGAAVWVGCVTSNNTLASVTAAGEADMFSGANELPLADVYIGVTNRGAPPENCNIVEFSSGSSSCPLPNDGTTNQTLLANAPAGTTELDWQYQLVVPANQAAGNYTGGEAVFTATAG
jgi:hypothetical protein